MGLGQGFRRIIETGLDVLSLEQLLQNLAPAAVARQHQNAVTDVLIVAQILGHRIQAGAVGRQLLGRHRQQFLGRAVFRVGGGQEVVEEHHRLLPEPVEDILVLRHIVAQLSGHQTALEHAVQLHAQLLLPQPGRPLEVAVVTEDHQGVFGNIVRAAGLVRVQKSQIPVGGGQGDAAFQPVQIPLQRLHQGCIDGLPALLSGDHGPEVVAQSRQAAGVEMELGLGHRQNGGLVGVFRPPLGQHIEKAHNIHFVTEKLHPQGVFTGRGKHVHNAAPQGVLTGALHQRGPGIPRLFQPPGQFLRLQVHAGPQRHGCAAESRLGHGPQG